MSCATLLKLYRETLDSSQFPQLLKNAFIIPIFKQGSRQDQANYRPVSLTSNLTKTFERVLRKCIVTHLGVKTKLNNAQHGFRSNRSCLTQLMQHYDDVLKMLQNCDNCDSIYLDFSKAFDKVNHGILLHKMKEIGFDGKIALWINNFLENRQQQVVVNGCRSKPSTVKSGVPQGTVLGPILFLLLINDIDKNIEESKVSIFADDTRIFRAISTINCVERLQNDLELLYKWEKDNNMKFNSKKFELIRYGPNEQIKMNKLYFTPNMENVIDKKVELTLE